MYPIDLSLSPEVPMNGDDLTINLTVRSDGKSERMINLSSVLYSALYTGQKKSLVFRHALNNKRLTEEGKNWIIVFSNWSFNKIIKLKTKLSKKQSEAISSQAAIFCRFPSQAIEIFWLAKLGAESWRYRFFFINLLVFQT